MTITAISSVMTFIFLWRTNKLGESFFAATPITAFTNFHHIYLHPPPPFISKKLPFSSWHYRLSHLFVTVTTTILRNNCLLFVPNGTPYVCPECPQVQAHYLPYPSFSTTKTLKSLELLWADVWSPSPYVSRLGFKYYLFIVDHFTRFTWFFSFKFESDVLSIFHSFITYAECFFNTKIISIQTDASGKFIFLKSLFTELGINHRFSCPHVPKKGAYWMQVTSYCWNLTYFTSPFSSPLYFLGRYIWHHLLSN